MDSDDDFFDFYVVDKHYSGRRISPKIRIQHVRTEFKVLGEFPDDDEYVGIESIRLLWCELAMSGLFDFNTKTAEIVIYDVDNLESISWKFNYRGKQLPESIISDTDEITQELSKTKTLKIDIGKVDFHVFHKTLTFCYVYAENEIFYTSQYKLEASFIILNLTFVYINLFI